MILHILVATVMAMSVGAGPSAQAATPAAALTGGWKLNMDASINPNGPDGAGAVAKGGRTDLRTGVGPPPGGELGPEEARRFNMHLAMFRQAPPLLGIKATDKDVVLMYDPDPSKGPVYKHLTDNKKVALDTKAGPVDVRAKWNGKALQREFETKESLKVVEEYTVSADGKQLTVTVKTSNIMVRMVNVEIKRVYERVQ